MPEVWIVNATNIRTGGMSNYVYAPGGPEDVRRIPGENRVDVVDSEEERNRGYKGERKASGQLHPWQGNDLDEEA